MKISSSFPRLHVLPDCTTVSGETLGQTTLDPEVILCVRECVCRVLPMLWTSQKSWTLESGSDSGWIKVSD